ncbi:MAG: hypothetical protein K1W20_00080 [Lachnospiraceae bacterium]
MKKGYYLHFQGRQSIGVSRKIDMQMEELGRYFDMQEIEVGTPKRSLAQRIAGLFPTASIARDYEEAFARLDHPDFVYVRRTVADRAYIRFFKKIRERYPACKIIIEIFTYPYDGDDFGKWNAWPFYVKEKLYRPQLKKYVDRFVTYTKDREIFGVPTICTYNGINVESMAKVGGAFSEGEVNLIGVAFMQRHHGYERIIEGLRQYYQTDGAKEYQVHLHLVGDGPEKPFYQELTARYGLEAYVHFYPTMVGKPLDELYDRCEIVLISFGMYKARFFGKMGALKSRECLAKGMPLLTGCAIDVLPDDYPYALVFPNDGSTVRTEDIISFYRKIRSKEPDKGKLADAIRQFAREHVSMEAVMEPIADYIGK